MAPTRPVMILLFAVAMLCCVSAAAVAEDEEEPGLWARLRAWRLAWIAGTDAWFFASPTAVWVNVQDTRMTPLVYGGPGAGFRFSDELVRERWIWETAATGSYALPQARVALPGLYQHISGEARMALLYRMPEIGLAAGGALNGGANIRFYDKLSNSAFSVDYMASISPALRWHLPFTALGRSFDWHVAAMTPLFSWVGRDPAYSLTGFASIWAPPWRFVRLTFQTGLTWSLRWSRENLLRLSYTWDFTALDELDGLHSLRVGSHSVELSLGTKRM